MLLSQVLWGGMPLMALAIVNLWMYRHLRHGMWWAFLAYLLGWSALFIVYAYGGGMP